MPKKSKGSRERETLIEKLMARLPKDQPVESREQAERVADDHLRREAARARLEKVGYYGVLRDME